MCRCCDAESAFGAERPQPRTDAEAEAGVADLGRDEEVGCVVLTGSDKAFAAGADIKEMRHQSERYGRLRREAEPHFSGS